MIGLCELEKKLADIRKRVEKEVFHPYLRQFIIPPVIDEDKILILISILDQLELSPHDKDTFILAIMLMQVALDTHDLVTNHTKNESSMKVRQLTVLAGDYYSGLYYKYLAKVGNISIIRMLSEGVKDVNEHKVIVYHQEPNDLATLMNSVKILEFSLIGKMTEYFGAAKWNNLISEYLLIKRLHHEKKEFEQTGHSFVFDALKKIIMMKKVPEKSIQYKQQLILACDRYIEYSVNQLRQEIKKVPRMNALLEDRLYEMIGSQHSAANIFAEEG